MTSGSHWPSAGCSRDSTQGDSKQLFHMKTSASVATFPGVAQNRSCEAVREDSVYLCSYHCAKRAAVVNDRIGQTGTGGGRFERSASGS